MKTKAERKDGGREWGREREGGRVGAVGGREDTANPDGFRGEQRSERESGATRGRRLGH